MERIITGRFNSKQDADVVAESLTRDCPGVDIRIFHGDQPHPAHAAPAHNDNSTNMAVAGGVAGGLIGALGGPILALAVAGLGAYAGSKLGGAEAAHPLTTEHHSKDRVMMSVHTDNPEHEKHIVTTLRAGNARDIMQSAGTWREGDWAEDHPVVPAAAEAIRVKAAADAKAVVEPKPANRAGVPTTAAA